MAYNLCQVMRKLTGAAKPRYLAVLAERVFSHLSVFWANRGPITKPASLLRHLIKAQTRFSTVIAG